LLLVSHSMYVVQKLCQKAVWIHEGRVEQYGDVFPVTQSYLAWHEKRTSKEKEIRSNASGDGAHYRIEKFELMGSHQDDPPEFVMGDDISVELQIYSPDDRPPVGLFGVLRADGTPVYGVASDHDISVELQIFSPDDRPPVGLFGVLRADGTPVYGVASDHESIAPVKLSEHYYQFRLCLKDIELLPGSYHLRGHSMDPEGVRLFDSHEFAFKVTGKNQELGFIRLPHEWLD